MGAPEVYARAVLLDGMAGLDVGQPEEGIVLVPALSVPDERPRQPWSLVDFPDGSWAVTVEHDYVVDDEDVLRPLHTARYVSLAGGPRPEELAAPTEMFGVVDDDATDTPEPAEAPLTAIPAKDVKGAGDYLTETEKVRLRRAKRAKEASGRKAHGRHRA